MNHTKSASKTLFLYVFLLELAYCSLSHCLMLKTSISSELSLLDELIEDSMDCSSPKAESSETLRCEFSGIITFLVFRALLTILTGTFSVASNFIGRTAESGRVVGEVFGLTILRTSRGVKCFGCVKYFECRVITSSVSSEISFFFSEAGGETFKQKSLAIRFSTSRKESSKRTSLVDLESRFLETVEFRLLLRCKWD